MMSADAGAEATKRGRRGAGEWARMRGRAGVYIRAHSHARARSARFVHAGGGGCATRKIKVI